MPIPTAVTILPILFNVLTPFLWLVRRYRLSGFILRYPAGKEDVTGIDYESWHYRYVGIEAARYLTEQQLTLDEFWAS